MSGDTEIYVQPEDLNALGSRLTQLHGELDNAEDYAHGIEGAFGHPDVSGAFDDYGTRWHKVAGDLKDSMTEAASFLNGAAETYTKHDQGQADNFDKADS